jgi:hypothetical protein
VDDISRVGPSEGVWALGSLLLRSVTCVRDGDAQDVSYMRANLNWIYRNAGRDWFTDVCPVCFHM